MQDQGQDAQATEAGDFQPSRRAIWVERALCLLILASLAGTFNLIITIHRRARIDQHAEQPPSPDAVVRELPKAPEPPNSPPSPPTPKIAVKKETPAPAQATEPPEDPTKKVLDELAVATAREVEAALEADRKAQAHERARQVAVAESERWKRREMLVTQQVASLSERARKIDQDIDKLADQRDVLARERDALKAAVTKAQQGEGSYAVLPYKGPNGSWRRPIVLECGNGGVSIRPKGPTFSMVDLSSLINPRSSPVIVAIARELLRVQRSESPDGAPVVPYFVFLVRPDGVRPYYELRARLEPLGIAFGYELIEQDLKVEVPDFDDISTWDGTIPLEIPGADLANGGLTDADAQDGLAWPGAQPGPRGDRMTGRGAGGSGAGHQPIASTGDDDPDSPDTFVWPSRPRGGTLSERSGRGGDTPDRSLSRRGGGDDGAQSGLVPSRGAIGSTSRATRGGLNFALESAPERPGGLEPSGTSRGEKSQRGMGQGSSGSPGGGRGRDLDGSLADSGNPGRSEAAEGTESDGPVPFPLGADASRSPLGLGHSQGTDAMAGVPDLEPAEPGPMASPFNPTPGRASGLGSQSRAGEVVSPGEPGSGTPHGLVEGTGQPSAGRAPQGDSRKVPSGAQGLPRGLQINPSQVANGSQPPLGALGLGLGSLMASGESSNPAGDSGMVLGSESASASKREKPEDAAGGSRIGSRIAEGPARKIDVPFEIVVVCQPEGLVIHPGGYRITRSAFERDKKDGVLVRELLAVARQRAAADPNIRPMPRVKFLVESGGSTTFWNARKQILFSGLGWPMSLQVTGAQSAPLLGQEIWQ